MQMMIPRIAGRKKPVCTAFAAKEKGAFPYRSVRRGKKRGGGGGGERYFPSFLPLPQIQFIQTEKNVQVWGREGEGKGEMFKHAFVTPHILLHSSRGSDFEKKKRRKKNLDP